MILGDMKFRVFNRTRYDVGIKTMNGLSFNITPGSFHILTADDIVFIESAYPNSKFFSKRILVPVNDKGEDVNIEEFGYDTDEHPHSNDTEVRQMLMQGVKKIEAWVSGIEDPAELHSIYLVAKEMDLPSSKLKVLKTYIKNKDWLGDLEEA